MHTIKNIHVCSRLFALLWAQQFTASTYNTNVIFRSLAPLMLTRIYTWYMIYAWRTAIIGDVSIVSCSRAWNKILDQFWRCLEPVSFLAVYGCRLEHSTPWQAPPGAPPSFAGCIVLWGAVAVRKWNANVQLRVVCCLLSCSPNVDFDHSSTSKSTCWFLLNICVKKTSR